ncbi:serine/threonine-protein kinase [Cronbergia sp. UHCC 0137]|uniref:serine/threonine-protein kinase n=1 Tax=Cronbergia sp. UHCC 0137 TaxID=3110239 RepID=UPI002B1EF782|nr:serine/threonine-protein kinase [Cronbergia sp. UHCC 0137]MEA5619819.1 serine/threonine-protein kinase [Cronbergia sp. UHCC 0137]
MQDWTTNTQLQNGQYIIKKVIARGGFGETYLAEDTEENRLVVIKTLNQQQREKPDFEDIQKKFRKEGLSLAKCHHPHIVQVYDTFLENDLWAIVMEHIDGDNLEAHINEYLQKNAYLSETEALRYINQIGQALEIVHERGLLHRDVKPSNILLRKKTKEAVLIDFGLAREFQLGKIRSMTVTKTEGYAPIEQYERRGDFGYYTDVYALAATLYTLLTTRVPIPSHYRAEGDAHLAPPRKYNQKISERVNTAILKGMELEPQNRPQTMREFREILGLVIRPSHPQRLREERRTLPPSPHPVSDEGELKSAVGKDYKKLRDLLAAGKWKEADEQTVLVMLAVAKRKYQGWLDIKNIDKFTCEGIHSIDKLWVKYSNGRFGFSVQKRVYQSLGGTRNYDEKIWEAFGEKIGWRNGERWLYYNDLNFDIDTAPEAHLPGGYLVGFGLSGRFFGNCLWSFGVLCEFIILWC